MTDPVVDPKAAETIAMMRQYRGLELIPPLLRLLSRGQPVTLDDVAAAAGVPVREAEELMTGLPTPERDKHGRITGLGLSLVPSEHRYSTGGQTLYTWCASDALIFPAVLGQPARIESRCPATGQAVVVEASPDHLDTVQPPTAVVSDLLPADAVPDIRTVGCAHGHFFSSRSAAAGWLTEHPDGRVCPVAEEFERSAHIAAALNFQHGDSR